MVVLEEGRYEKGLKLDMVRVYAELWSVKGELWKKEESGGGKVTLGAWKKVVKRRCQR